MATQYLTTDEAAEYLRVSRRTLLERVRLGQIVHFKPSYQRRVLFRADELDQWLEGCELEVVHLDGGGRRVRPVQDTA